MLCGAGIKIASKQMVFKPTLVMFWYVAVFMFNLITCEPLNLQ